jgi:hypothetical protein
MANPAHSGATKKRWLWTFGLVLLAIAVSFWFARPLGEPAKVEPGKPQAQSTEWAPDAGKDAVPVDLPTTPMTNAPEAPQVDVDIVAGKED